MRLVFSYEKKGLVRVALNHGMYKNHEIKFDKRNIQQIVMASAVTYVVNVCKVFKNAPIEMLVYQLCHAVSR